MLCRQLQIRSLRQAVLAALSLLLLSTCLAQVPRLAPVDAERPKDRETMRYRLKDDAPPTGSHIAETRAYANRYPLDRPYSRFTPEEKARLRAEYESMPEEDEPPFPEQGFRPIIEQIARMIPLLRVEGYIHINVTVDKDGKATKFDLMKYPSNESARSVAYLLSQAKYKPAVCSGQPCEMQLPFRANLVRQ
jgi:hypothetical protein